MRTLRIFFISSLLFPISTFSQVSVVAQSTAKELTTDEATLRSQVGGLTTTRGIIMPLVTEVEAGVAACTGATVSTDNMCGGDTSPGIVTFMSEYGPLLQMASTMMSMKDSCSSLSDLLKKASLALTAYQTACAVAMMDCKTACSKLKSSLAKLESTITKQAIPQAEMACAQSMYMGPSCAEAKTALPQMAATAKKMSGTEIKVTTACKGYDAMRNAAIAGIIQSVAQMKTAKNCENNTGDGASIAANACIDQKNPYYVSKNCQCARNELPAGECQGISVAAVGGTGGSGVRVGTGGGTETGTADVGGGGGESQAFAVPKSSEGGGSAAAGAPVGSGMSAGGGGGSGAFGMDGSGAAKKLNANILGGFGGGGGGGGGSNGAGPGYGEVDKKLQEHGPGGKNDPSRSIASQIAKEVTAQGGRSNWEKVRARYKDNQRTLLLNK